MELPSDYASLAYQLASQAAKTRIELTNDQDMAGALEVICKATKGAKVHQPRLLSINTVSSLFANPEVVLTS